MTLPRDFDGDEESNSENDKIGAGLTDNGPATTLANNDSSSSSSFSPRNRRNKRSKNKKMTSTEQPKEPVTNDPIVAETNDIVGKETSAETNETLTTTTTTETKDVSDSNKKYTNQHQDSANGKDNTAAETHVLPTLHPTEAEYNGYETTNKNYYNNKDDDMTTTNAMIRRLSRGVSDEWNRRRRSSFKEQLPQTTHGWAILLSTLSAMILRYELKLQHSLTCPPHVYGQVVDDSSQQQQQDNPNDYSRLTLLQEIYQTMSQSDTSILRRNIQPSLFVGTRGALASAAAFLLGGPADSDKHLRFREHLKLPADGSVLAIDWELPHLVVEENDATTTDKNSINQRRKQEILQGPIIQPVIIILHGMNNHSDFGYVRSMMRTCAERGWVAAGMNLRGCGGVPLQTPRGYNGGYTGDIRGVVYSISGRLSESSCIFLVGNSLGANLVTKYLGEEGLSGTLPETVAGGVALGNPLSVNSRYVSFLWSNLLALGAKKTVVENWLSLNHVNDANARRAYRNALLAVTLAQFDEALAPIFIRNERFYPFSARPGFLDADDYYNDASSYRVVPFISVPFLTLAAKDDMIVYNPARRRMAQCLSNPNVLWVETMCGGHLGWQEAPPETGNWGFHSSWADSAMADFVQATLQARERRRAAAADEDDASGVGNTIHTSGMEGFAESPPMPLSRL